MLSEGRSIYELNRSLLSRKFTKLYGRRTKYVPRTMLGGRGVRPAVCNKNVITETTGVNASQILVQTIVNSKNNNFWELLGSILWRLFFPKGQPKSQFFSARSHLRCSREYCSRIWCRNARKEVVVSSWFGVFPTNLACQERHLSPHSPFSKHSQAQAPEHVLWYNWAKSQC